MYIISGYSESAQSSSSPTTRSNLPLQQPDLDLLFLSSDRILFLTPGTGSHVCLQLPDLSISPATGSSLPVRQAKASLFEPFFLQSPLFETSLQYADAWGPERKSAPVEIGLINCVRSSLKNRLGCRSRPTA
jgi:hypothetical protein